MKTQTKVIIVTLFISILVIGYLMSQIQSATYSLGQKPCKPTFADGDGPYYRPDPPFRSKIVPDKNSGLKLTVKGKVLKNDCKTEIPGAIISIWQADENGKYQNDWYRGRIKSKSNGYYEFETIIPKGYGEGTGYRNNIFTSKSLLATN